jgi:cytidylate kinase
MIVAVDGPSGAGKSSVCQAVAKRLGFILVDTGALYRSVALNAVRHGIDLGAADALGALTRGLSLRFVYATADAPQRLLCDGEDISHLIRTEEISKATSQISQHPPVRAALLQIQRDMGRSHDAIVEGRDISTVVFPDADLKVFYTASAEARARRRWRELQAQGDPEPLADVLRDIEARDARDSQRAAAPLLRAPDATLLDTSDLDFNQSCDALAALITTHRAP